MARTVIVGDIHGCREELVLLLRGMGFGTGDRLVFVGDLIARGPDSLGVLDLVRETGAPFVLGNHEAKLLAHRADRTVPLGKMHSDLFNILRPIDWKLLESAPLWLDLPENGIRIVHGGIIPGIPWEEQTATNLLHLRAVNKAGQAGVRGVDRLWGELYQGPPHIVFGHNALDGLQIHPWATGLDTGCVYGGRLTALVLEDREMVPRTRAEREKRLVIQAAAKSYVIPGAKAS